MRTDGERRGRKKKVKAENQIPKASLTNDNLEALKVPQLRPPSETIHSHVHFLNLLSKKKSESQIFYLHTFKCTAS